MLNSGSAMPDYYEVYVGNITPEQFIEPYALHPDPIGASIDDLTQHWPWDQEIPPGFQQWMESYLENHLPVDVIPSR